MPLLLVKAGRRKSNRPDCSVEVVEATVMKRSSALAMPATPIKANHAAMSRTAQARPRIPYIFLSVHAARRRLSGGMGDGIDAKGQRQQHDTEAERQRKI